MDRKEAKGIAYFCKLEGKVTEDAHREDFWENILEALAQPEIIHCKDCRYYEEFTDSISSKSTKGCTLHYVEKDGHGFCDEARKK